MIQSIWRDANADFEIVQNETEWNIQNVAMWLTVAIRMLLLRNFDKYVTVNVKLNNVFLFKILFHEDSQRKVCFSYQLTIVFCHFHVISRVKRLKVKIRRRRTFYYILIKLQLTNGNLLLFDHWNDVFVYHFLQLRTIFF